jgi:hypothetical protein
MEDIGEDGIGIRITIPGIEDGGTIHGGAGIGIDRGTTHQSISEEVRF